MRTLNFLTSLLLLATTPTMLVYSQHTMHHVVSQTQGVDYTAQRTEKDYVLSYDDILCLIDEIESGALEDKCSLETLEKVKYFIAFLAKQGALPDDSEESSSLNKDIECLLNGEENIYQDAVSFVSPGDYQYMIVPAVLHGDGEVVLCKSWLKKQWKHVAKFAKKHKKALLIGAAIVVGAAVVVAAVSAVAGAVAVVTASALAGDSDSQNRSEEGDCQEDSLISVPKDIPSEVVTSHEAPILKAAVDNYISSFKENIVQNQFFQLATPEGQQGLPWQENARVLGSLFSHISYNELQNQLLYYPELAQEAQDVKGRYNFCVLESDQGAATGHSEIDRKFSTDYSYLYSRSFQELDFNTVSYQVRGELALSLGCYDQAVQDFGRVIDMYPTNPITYLERGIANFGLGEYDHSIEDYKQFVSQSQKTDGPSISEFSLGFAKGLPKGVYESGEGLFLFMVEFVKHPIQTSEQIVDSVSTLVALMREDQWGTVAEALCPEVHQLVIQWDTLSSETRGELAGYALGKHGADILAPGALTKLAGKSIKSAQELAAVCKNFQIAKETLILETAAEIGNNFIVAEVVRSGQMMRALGEDLGFSAGEMGQLKRVGGLEGAINKGLEAFVSQDSGVLQAAISQDKHVNMVRDYLNKPIKEIQKGVNSYEKQILVHKDKIANPTKYYPDWDKLDPRQRDALVNKKWPSEIQGYEEQRNILQSILNERISHE